MPTLDRRIGHPRRGGNAVFAYDFKIALSPNSHETRIRHFPYSLWRDRYLSVFSKLEVFGREFSGPEDEARNFPVSSGNNINFCTLPNLYSLQGQLFKRSTARRILEARIQNADVVVARLPSEIGHLAVSIARRRNIPYVIEVVGCPLDGLWHQGSIRGKLWAPISSLRLKLKLRAATHVIYVTSAYLQSRYPTRGTHISCSNVTLPSSEPATLLSRIDSIRKSKTKRIGMIGYLGTNVKGADTAIRAVAKMKSTQIQLELVGGGDTRRLQALTKKLGLSHQVSFLGQLPHSEVLQWLDSIDLYIQPSRTEGLPRALLEAMSRGCPAVGSTAGGIPELLPSAHLHRPGNHQHLSRLIHKALTNSERRMQMAEQNFIAAQAYCFEEINRRRVSFLSSVLSSSE